MTSTHSSTVTTFGVLIFPDAEELDFVETDRDRFSVSNLVLLVFIGDDRLRGRSRELFTKLAQLAINNVLESSG